MDMSGKPASEHFLAQIDRLIDLRPFSMLIEAIGERMHAELPAGVVKMLLLARWYGLGEAALLDACQDRLSFRRFLGLPLDNNEGDVRLAEAYRGAAQFPMEAQNLIHAIEAQLLAKGFSVRPGMWSEASVVQVSEGMVLGGDTGDDLDFSQPGQGWGSGARRAAASHPGTTADRPAAGGDKPAAAHLTETSIFQPGELAGMADKGESALVRGIAKSAAAGIQSPTAPVELVAHQGPRQAPVHAIIEWPSGTVTEFSDQLNIGRDRRFCAFATELKSDQHVSRQHAVLKACPEGIWVRDLGSRNGTFVDDEPLPNGQAFLIESDARIRFGPHCVVQLKLRR